MIQEPARARPRPPAHAQHLNFKAVAVAVSILVLLAENGNFRARVEFSSFARAFSVLTAAAAPPLALSGSGGAAISPSCWKKKPLFFS